MPAIPIALQLWTIRDVVKEDYVKAVKEVAKIGYAGIEVPCVGDGLSPSEVKKVLDDNGLKIAGDHTRIEALETDLNKVLDKQDALGNKLLTISWMPEQRRKDAAGWRQVAQSLSHFAQGCAKRGVTLMYHNHSFEFERFNGTTGFDILWEQADPLVKAQLDVYWLKHGNQDPAAWIDKLGSRVPLLHLKDMEPGPEMRFAPVGTGILDFGAILGAADRVGVKWGIVEQDRCYDTPPLEAVRVSFENLRKLGGD